MRKRRPGDGAEVERGGLRHVLDRRFMTRALYRYVPCWTKLARNRAQETGAYVGNVL